MSKAYNIEQVDGNEHRSCTDCGATVGIRGTWGQPEAKCGRCDTVKYFCMKCLEVVVVQVDDNFKSKSVCAKCGHANCVPHSIGDVYKKYPGYLAREIIDARSSLNINGNDGGEHGNDAIDSVSGSSGDDGACGDVARAESEALAHA